MLRHYKWMVINIIWVFPDKYHQKLFFSINQFPVHFKWTLTDVHLLCDLNFKIYHNGHKTECMNLNLKLLLFLKCGMINHNLRVSKLSVFQIQLFSTHFFFFIESNVVETFHQSYSCEIVVLKNSLVFNQIQWYSVIFTSI